jgi:hypothetical protein
MFDVAKTLIVSGATALSMIAFGVFWMFMWLLGTNGYSESKGTLILGSNLAMVILSVVVSTAASAWLTNKLKAREGWPMWALAPSVILGVVTAAVILMFAGSLIIIALFGRTR